MFYHLLRFFSLFLLTSSLLTGDEASSLSHHVLVSVAPYKAFVESIAGDTVKVGVMVPAGASVHSYEPSLKEMLAAGKADLWFLIGETFEIKASQAFKNHHPRMELVDLKQGVDLIYNDLHCHSGHSCQHGVDLHIWLSPKASMIQARLIAEKLTHLYPEHRQLYEKNLHFFLEQLKTLDLFVQETLKFLKDRVILVSHPAYGYFCRDYELKQLSIEFEGKDPTPFQLTILLDQARRLHITKVFIQPQYNSKGARLVAEYLGAKIIPLDPYSEDYIASIKQIALAFAKPS